MSKIMNFLLDITITKECMYILLFKVLLIGITKKDTGVSNATSLTIGIHKLHFTIIIGLQHSNVLDENHGIS